MKKKKPQGKVTPTGVSTKSYKPPVPSAKTKSEILPQSKKLTPRAKKLIIIITAVVLVLAIAGGIVALVVYNINNNRRIDFLNDDLSQYVTLTRGDYIGADINVSVPPVSEDEVYTEILKALASKKGNMLNHGDYMYTMPLGAGDKAYIYYRGYELDDEGNKIDLSGTCNMFKYEPEELVIGSGSMVPGFELQLLSQVPNFPDKPDDEDATDGLQKRNEGEIKDTDLVFVKATYAEESGDFHEDAQLVIDFSNTALDEKWGTDKNGKGIREYIREIGLGNTADALEEQKWFGEFETASGDSVTVIKMEVMYAAEIEAEPIFVEVTFPYDYEEESFRNKKVYFDVYITRAVHYESAEWGDEFITDVLNEEPESFDKYEGNTLTERYVNGLCQSMTDDRRNGEGGLEDQKVEAFWEHVTSRAVFKKIPEGEIKAGFDRYYDMYLLLYINQYKDAFETIDAYIASVYNLADVTQWRDHLRSVVEDEVKEKIIFFYIMRNEDMVPTDEEFRDEYRSILEAEYYTYHDKTREDFSSDAAYDKVIADYEEDAINDYGYDIYFQITYYNLRLEDIINLTEVHNEFEFE